MWVYSSYRIAFDGAGSSNFGNDLVRNVIIFGINNSLSSYTDNQKNNFFKFKDDNKNVNFPTQFCLGSISNGLHAREEFSGGNVFDFPVDYDHIDKSDINIHKYLMAKNNI